MTKKKTPSKPKRPAKQKAGGGCPGASCSPSDCNTPQTDAATYSSPPATWDEHYGHHYRDVVPAEKCAEIERKQNQAIRLLRALKADIDHIGHWLPDPCRKMVESFLLENAKLSRPLTQDAETR